MEWTYSTIFTILLGIITLIFGLYLYSISTFNYWKNRGIKSIPHPVPLFGNVTGSLFRKKSRVDEQNIWYNMFPEEKYIGFFMFKIPMLMIRDPEIIHNVLIKDFSHFYNRGIPFNEKVDTLSSHLINLKDEKWKNLRKKLTPSFSSSKLKIMFQPLEDCANEMDKFLIETIKNGDVFDVRDAMAKFSTDVIGSCAFGVHFNSLKDPESEFRKVGRAIFKPTYRPILRLILLQIHSKLVTFLNFKVIDPKIEAFFLNFVKDSVEFREKNNIQKKDFLQILIDLRKEDISGSSNYVQNKFDLPSKETTLDQANTTKSVILDDQLMASNMFIFFIAGFETTASTMSYCLLELAANPNIQEKLVKEILLTMELNNNILTYDVIKNMPYMEMVIKETTRKYPVAFFLIRQCNKAYQFPDSTFSIEENKSVIIPTYALHHDSKYYPDPEMFDPERFSEENKNKIPPGAYLPFGDGPRICIGLRLAMMEMKIAFCKILPRYEFHMTNKMNYPIEFDKRTPLLTPQDGIWLKITKRETAYVNSNIRSNTVV